MTMCQRVTLGKRRCPYQAKVINRLEHSKSPMVTTGTGKCDNMAKILKISRLNRGGDYRIAIRLYAKNKGELLNSPLRNLVRRVGFEPATPWFVARYSIQLSYRRVRTLYYVSIPFLSNNMIKNGSRMFPNRANSHYFFFRS